MEDRKSGSSSKDWDFFRLPRPQYPGAPEVLVSSLSWCMTTSGRPRPIIGGQEHAGLIYQRSSQARQGKKALLETSPRRGEAAWMGIEDVLRNEFGLDDAEKASRATEILVEDLVGNVPARALSRAVIPFNANLALMQDSRGMLGVDNPPNFALIFQRMFALGGGEGGASERLAKAFADLANGDDWFDKATAAMLPQEIGLAAREILHPGPGAGCERAAGLSPAWLRKERTPFHWFAGAWESLMDHEWKKVMPRRRWIDWAMCVLRTGLGAGYVYEMNFYYRLMLALESPESPTDAANRILQGGESLFPWDAFASVSSRDVAGRIKTMCERGTACRTLLKDWVEEQQDRCPSPLAYLDEDGLVRWIGDVRAWLSKDPDSRKGKLRKAISGAANRAARNVYETITYALLDRGKPGVSEDLYSLLAKRGGRYTVVEPGQEWLVVVASMQARQPGQVTRVAAVLDALEQLGLKTGYKTIVKELERAGLARTSHDADDAIEIVSAF